MTTRIYLDHAATAPMTAAARAAVARGWDGWANPSSPHAEGRGARAALEQARGAIGAAYGWRHETLLTSGASESLAIALGRSVMARRLILATEHDAVIRAAPHAAMLPVDAQGLIDADALQRALADGPALVAVQWANSETGVRQPIAEVAARVHAAGGLLLVDAAQMPAGADPAVAGHADFVALSAHKRGGPPGVGALLVRDLAALEPTGGQERGYRPGTENLPGALGYAAALDEPEDLAAVARLRTRLDDAVVRSGGIVVAGAAARHPAIGSYRMPGVASATQLIRLDLAGFAVSAGSACASGSLKPSHVLAAMAWPEAAAREVVRVSFGRGTIEADVDAFVAAWRSVARGARDRGMTYLDYQATTPLAPEALAAMLPWLERQHANPHSPHREGGAARAAVEVARDQVAALLPPGGRVAFTGGATEALNWAIKGTTGPIVTIATEHAAVLDTVDAERRGAAR